jgi:hypothetical protein
MPGAYLVQLQITAVQAAPKHKKSKNSASVFQWQ